MTENDVLAVAVIAWFTSTMTLGIVRASLNYRTAKRRDQMKTQAGS